MPPTPDPQEISVTDYARLRDAGADHLLLDVREPSELGICRIEDCVNIPLGELEARLDELADWRSRPVIALCRSGRRSLTAFGILRSHGFSEVRSLRGGILAWGEEIDPSLSAY